MSGSQNLYDCLSRVVKGIFKRSILCIIGDVLVFKVKNFGLADIENFWNF